MSDTNQTTTNSKSNAIYTVLPAVPYQLCPKCNGQGIVSKPPNIAGDIYQWTSSEAPYTCDVCNGKKIIPMYMSNCIAGNG